MPQHQSDKIVAGDGSSRIPVPVARQGMVDRIKSEVRNLVQDAMDYSELRMKLVQIEIEEKVDTKINAMLDKAIAGVFALIALIFGLITIALFLGIWLGHPAWGFFAVTLFVGLVVLVIVKARPRVVQIKQDKLTVAAAERSEPHV